MLHCCHESRLLALKYCKLGFRGTENHTIALCNHDQKTLALNQSLYCDSRRDTFTFGKGEKRSVDKSIPRHYWGYPLSLILPCATLVHNQGTYSILLRSLVTNKDLGWVQRMICWYPTLEEITVVAKDEPNQYFRLDNGTWCHEWDWEKNLLLEGCLEFWEEAVRRGRIPKERRSHRSML